MHGAGLGTGAIECSFRHEHVSELALPLGRGRCLTPIGQRQKSAAALNYFALKKSLF
jgi:hypothetical protein